MSKCEHGQKITTFCASECCVWKQAGGCNSCMKKYHNHMGPTIFVPEQTAQQIIKKFNVDPSTKPKCRSLQQAIFNYFNLIKTEFIAFVDNACMDIINQIGHPYLTQTDLLTTYKRIKKKDYKKIQQKQFRYFYEKSQNISQVDLIENEKKIYIQKVKQKSEFINSLEKLIRSIQKMNKDYEETYLPAHDGAICLKINEIVKNILKTKNEENLSASTSNQGRDLTQSEKLQWKGGKLDFNLSSKLQKVESLPTSTDKYELSSTEKSQGLRDSNKYKDNLKQVGVQKQKGTPKLKEQSREPQKQSQHDRKKPRVNSIDRHFIKTNNLDKKKELQRILNELNISKKMPAENDKVDFDFERKKVQEKDNNKQKQQSTPRRRMFECKQLQINEKKQKLIDMMKNKQQSSSPVRQQRIFQTPQTIKTNKESESKMSENESDSEMDVRKDLSLCAHTILPISEERQKLFEDTEQVTQKTIIVPVESKLHKEEPEECVSPLLKSRLKERDAQRFDLKGNKPRQVKELQNISPSRRKQAKEQLIDLTQKQQKSLALLIKSLNAKAQEAVPYLQSALHYAQDNLSAAQYLTYLYLQLDKPKECLTLCNKMLQKLSHSSISSELSWHLNINKSAALNKLGRYSQSIVILQETLKYKQHAKLYKNLGDAYFSIGIYQKSNYYYEKAIGMEDSYDEAHYNLAVCLFMQENYHNAKFSVAKALVYNPNNPNYLQLQKQINLRIKDI